MGLDNGADPDSVFVDADATDVMAAPVVEPTPIARARTRVRDALKLDAPPEPGATEQAPGVKKRSGTTGAERRRRAKAETERKDAARKSTAAGFAAVYGQIGAIALNSGDPDLVPFGRAVQVNAPIAGQAFDELVKGTRLDEMLQPVADRGNEVKNFANALGFPVLILLMTKRPEMYPSLGPVAYSMFAQNIAAMGPMIAERKKQEAAANKIVKQMADEGMIHPTGPSGEPATLQTLFESLFAPADLAPPPPPDEP